MECVEAGGKDEEDDEILLSEYENLFSCTSKHAIDSVDICYTMDNISENLYSSRNKDLSDITWEICQTVGNCEKLSEAKGSGLHQNLVKSQNQHWFSPSHGTINDKNGIMDDKNLKQDILIKHNGDVLH
eukprot:1656427-Ditylum_brightwellii.AAC.1